MTKDEELRRGVAVEIMGWEKAEMKDVCCYPDDGGPEFTNDPSPTSNYHWRDLCGWDGQEWKYIPAYEGDIAAAWEVIDKMWEREFYAKLEKQFQPMSGWAAIFWEMEPSEGPWRRQCQSAAEAICHAALATVRATQ